MGNSLPLRASRAATKAPRSLQHATASFSTSRSTLQNDPIPSPSIIELRKQEQNDEAKNTDDDAEEVPWYLEVEAPKHPTLVVEAPPLPDVPEGAPKVTTPLVKFTSEALGLDDLKILDLRKLDPPPALGPNLIMIFGTARSERHLHVCADRMVRWFKKQGIQANADGLLGRNELRTKEKRLARKMKRMGSGYSRNEDEDDGISTQWVCVNAGTVGGPEAGVEHVITSEDGKVMGFGVPQTGSTIVVQMFLAARREELNLEGYWSNKLLTPEERRAKNEAKKLADPFNIIKPADTNRTPGAVRYFSTSARRPQNVTDHRPDPLAEMASLFSSHKFAPSPGIIDRLQDILRWDVDQKMSLLNKMQDLPVPSAGVAEARAAHGKETDLKEATSPAEFVQLYTLAMENLPPAQKWEYQLWLAKTGRTKQWPGFDLGAASSLVQQMKSQGLEPTSEQYVDLFKAIYYGRETENGDVGREQSQLAMQVIDTMFERGLDVLSNDVLVSLLETLTLSRAKGTEVTRLKNNLEFIMTEAKLPYMGEGLLIKLLNAHARVKDWDKFWEVWRIPPRFEVARSEALYFYMWRRLAETRDKAQCIRAVRNCFHEMVNEQPPVAPVGRVRDALISCIVVADRKAMAVAMDPERDVVAAEQQKGREFARILVDIGVGPRG